MIPTISQVCTLNASFQRDIDDLAAAHCEAVELWLTKLETFLQDHSVDDVRRLLDENRLVAPVASFQGGVLSSQGESRKEAWQLLTRRLDLLRELQVETLVVACDIHGPMHQQDVDRVRASLVQLAREAGQRGRRVALEFQATSALGNNLQTAAALVEEVGSPHLGLCFDVFHFYTGPSKIEDLASLQPGNLFHVQFCDLADTPREFATDAQRIIPGDGDFQFEPIIRHLEGIGYRGCVSLELMNPQLWQVPPLQLGEIGMTAMRKLLGQADMGEAAAGMQLRHRDL